MLIFEIFHTELSKFPRGGLDHTYKTSFKIWATVIVPVYIEFTGFRFLAWLEVLYRINRPELWHGTVRLDLVTEKRSHLLNL